MVQPKLRYLCQFKRYANIPNSSEIVKIKGYNAEMQKIEGIVEALNDCFACLALQTPEFLLFIASGQLFIS
jgi:hypothetical protein